MSVLRIRYAADSASGAIQDRIRFLTEQIKAQPDDERLLLELAHLYAQIWIQTQRIDVLQRVLVCLERAVALENGQYSAQLAKLLEGVTRHVRDRGLAEPLAKLEELTQRSAARSTGPVPPPTPAPPAAPPPVAPPAAPPPAAPPPVAPPAVIPPPAATPPPATPPPRTGEAPVSPVAPAPAAPTPPSATGETPVLPSAPEGPHSPSPWKPPEPVETRPEEKSAEDSVLDTVPSVQDNSSSSLTAPTGYPRPPAGGPGRSPGDFDVDVHTVEAESAPPDRRRFARDMAASGASSLRDIQQLFEAGRLTDILRAYTALSDIRTKRRIIEGLIERIPEWRIEPVLAVGALETDEQVFRFIMRTLLRRDRSEICKQINLAAYSSDLQKVAVIVLSELGVRSALAKLEGALQLNDPIVRTVAAHGIARTGKAAVAYIPKLIDTVCSDPNVEVRRSAAKALNAMNVKEAYEAFEDAAKRTRFDPETFVELEAMRERFGGARRAKTPEQEKAPGAKPARRGKAKGTGKNPAGQLIAVIVVVLLLAFAWQQIKSKIPSLSSGPPPEETAPAGDRPAGRQGVPMDSFE